MLWFCATEIAKHAFKKEVLTYFGSVPQKFRSPWRRVKNVQNDFKQTG